MSLGYLHRAPYRFGRDAAGAEDPSEMVRVVDAGAVGDRRAAHRVLLVGGHDLPVAVLVIDRGLEFAGGKVARSGGHIIE